MPSDDGPNDRMGWHHETHESQLFLKIIPDFVIMLTLVCIKCYHWCYLTLTILLFLLDSAEYLCGMCHSTVSCCSVKASNSVHRILSTMATISSFNAFSSAADGRWSWMLNFSTSLLSESAGMHTLGVLESCLELQILAPCYTWYYGCLHNLLCLFWYLTCQTLMCSWCPLCLCQVKHKNSIALSGWIRAGNIDRHYEWK